MNKKVSTIVLSVVVIAFVVFAAMNYKQESGYSISKEEAVNKALEYINLNLVEQGVNVSLSQIYESEKNAPYYTFQINIMGQLFDSVVTADGSKLFTNSGIDLNKKLDEKVDGNFLVKENAEIITEDGKPVVFLFASSTCPHCEWEKPVLKAVLDQFEDQVIYKVREDTTEDQDVYNQFGSGGVPLVVLGGKYYREGAGENFGEEKEKEYLTKYICELTGGMPENICQ
ncbi:MAG TPA: thioredoxin family protein [Candidatus Pacearchaeota archaeon]|nr:thioredoxin family protein [Candidatus Pacearchaeota archaeon]